TAQAERLVGEMHVQIAERQVVEQQLRVRERAIEATSTGIANMDLLAEGYPIVYVNPAFERLTGYSATEMRTRDLGVLAGPETSQLERAQVQAAMHAVQETAATN